MSVRQNPEDREQAGILLHLVDDNQAPQRPKRGHWLRQALCAHGILKIEVLRRGLIGDRARKSRLSALARPI